MPRYESRTFPFPLKKYLDANAEGPRAFTLRSKRFSRTPSSKHKRSKNGDPQPSQLELPLTKKFPSNERCPTMTEATSFEDILNQQVDDVKPPPLLPVGTYLTVIAGLPERGKSSQKQTDFFKFTHRIVAADEDVDQAELDEAFPDGLAGKTIDNTFYITTKSAFMLTDFIKNCIGEEAVKGKTVAASIEEVVNAEVKIQIKHEPVGDTGRFRATIARTLPAGE